MAGRTYRYIKDNENVLYPFGFGLTYSSVEVIGLSFEGGRANVSFKNTGLCDTQDVIELYLKANDEQCSENYHLCGFARVDTKAGCKGSVLVSIPERAMTFVTPGGKRVRAESFTLYASTHQPDPLSCKLNGTEFVSIDVQI